MALRSEHARQRIAAAATLLHDLWGDGLPPGPAPWQRIAADMVDVDDGFGEQHGVTVQGDEFSIAVLAEALSYVPAGASLHGMLPPSLVDRMRHAAAVRDPDARDLTIGARLMSAAIRASVCRWAGLYLRRGQVAELQSSLGMTPWERAARSRIPLPGRGPLCKAMLLGVTSRGLVEVPVLGAGWGGEVELIDAPCIATPFPATGRGAPAVGAMLLVWPADADPDVSVVGPRVAPLVAEAEHLFTTGGR